MLIGSGPQRMYCYRNDRKTEKMQCYTSYKRKSYEGCKLNKTTQSNVHVK